MLEQRAYEFGTPHFCRSVQWGSPFLVLHSHIRAMLEQHTYEFSTPRFCRSVQRGSPFLVLHSDIRAILEQHLYDLDPSSSRRNMQRGPVPTAPHVYVCTVSKQYSGNIKRRLNDIVKSCIGKIFHRGVV